MARVMFEGAPFHVTHRGNHKRIIFEDDRQRQMYLDLLRAYSRQFEMSVWGYALMSNHVHLIVTGRHRHSIPRAVGNAHRAFSRRCNERGRVTGHRWANRYFSTVLDEPHLWAAIRYVELNPVRAGIVRDATTFHWSSARAHASLIVDNLLDPDRPFPGPVANWRQWLSQGLEEETLVRIRENTASGAPTGDMSFVAAIERRLGRSVRKRRDQRRVPVPETRVWKTSP
jgi:putative transposase